jgi:hypothetical protein
MDSDIVRGMTGRYYDAMVLNRWFVSEYYRIFHNSIPHISFGIRGHGSIVSEFSLSFCRHSIPRHWAAMATLRVFHNLSFIHN